MSPAGFQQISGVDDDTLQALREMLALLTRWQHRINLVARDSMTDMWRRHVLDSAQLTPLIPLTAANIFDLGSGAGFPGLVVALVTARPIHLVESDGRKCAFLREAARCTGAQVEIHNRRIETLGELPADVVMARACAPLPKLLGYASLVLAPGGIGLLLKGRQIAAELTEAKKAWMMRATLIQSRSDPSGTILKVAELQRRDDPRPH